MLSVATTLQETSLVKKLQISLLLEIFLLFWFYWNKNWLLKCKTRVILKSPKFKSSSFSRVPLVSFYWNSDRLQSVKLEMRLA